MATSLTLVAENCGAVVQMTTTFFPTAFASATALVQPTASLFPVELRSDTVAVPEMTKDLAAFLA